MEKIKVKSFEIEDVKFELWATSENEINKEFHCEMRIDVMPKQKSHKQAPAPHQSFLGGVRRVEDWRELSSPNAPTVIP